MWLKNLLKKLDHYTNSLNFSQGYVSGKEKVQEMVDLMRAKKWDWNRSPLDVQEIDGTLVSGDNRRLAAARIAGCECSIVKRNADEPMEGKQGFYGKNLQKKLNLTPYKSGLDKIDLRPHGSRIHLFYMME